MKRTPRKPQETQVYDKRECVFCNRMVTTLNGKMIVHRKKENRRGYGYGEVCCYNEVTTEPQLA